MLKFQFWKKFFGGKWDFLRLLARRGKWVWVFNVPAEKTIWERELKIYLFIWRGNLILNPNIFCRKSIINLMRSMNSHSAYFNLFHATGLFRYPLKTEKLWFSDVFSGYRKRPVAWTGLKRLKSMNLVQLAFYGQTSLKLLVRYFSFFHKMLALKNFWKMVLILSKKC